MGNEMSALGGLKSGGKVPTPMEIDNFEHRGRRPKKEGRRLKDYKRNSCFTCHKVGCRPWKHLGNVAANKFEVSDELEDEVPEGQSSDSKN